MAKAGRNELLKERDLRLNQRYTELYKKNRGRSNSYLYSLLTEEFFLGEDRIRHIIKGHYTKYKEKIEDS